MICVQGNYQVIAKLRILNEKLFHLRKYVNLINNIDWTNAGRGKLGNTSYQLVRPLSQRQAAVNQSPIKEAIWKLDVDHRLMSFSIISNNINNLFLTSPSELSISVPHNFVYLCIGTDVYINTALCRMSFICSIWRFAV